MRRKHHRKLACLSLAAVAVGAADRAMAQFTGFSSPNDLVLVTLTNDGLAQTNDAVSLQEYTPAGVAVGNPLDLPTADGSALTLPDASNRDGQLTLSTNGKFLLLGTYLADVDAANAADAETPEEAPRVITEIYANGTLNTSTQLTGTDDYNGVSIRQVASVDGLEFWTAGNNGKPYSAPTNGDVGGLRYSTLGASTSTGMNGGLGFDNRTALIYNQQLYVDTGSDNSPDGDHTFFQAGSPGYPLPTTTPVYSALQLTGGGDIPGNQSPNFVTLQNGTVVLYESDSSANSIDKLVQDRSDWIFEGRVSLSSNANVAGGVQDLLTSVSGNTVNLYVTTDNGVYSLTDTGGNGNFSSTTLNTLITPAANQQFRGISFAPLSTINSDWNMTAGNTWSTYVDWDNGVPWNPGDTATFGGKLAASGNVTLDGNWTVGHIVFDNSSASYSLLPGSPAGTLTPNDAGGTGVADITVQAGSHTIAAPISLTAGVTVNLASGTSLTVSNTITGSGATNVTGPGKLIVAVGGELNPAGNLNISNGADVALATGSGAQTVTGLSVSSNATLDVNNNHIFIAYGSGSDPIASIQALLAKGYNGGAWNGASGIISTAAAANSASYGLGYADSADPGNPAGLATDTIEIKYTLLGDANLDGVVNGTDFGILAANFNKGVTGWDKGDFFYANVVNATDFGALAKNFNKGATGASIGEPAYDDPAILAFAAANGLLADVPEPASAALFGVFSMALLTRRRRKTAGSNKFPQISADVRRAMFTQTQASKEGLVCERK